MQEIDFNDIEMEETLEMKLDRKMYFMLQSNDAKDVRKAVRRLFGIKKGLSRMERKILGLILDYPKYKLLKSIRKNQDITEKHDRERVAEEFEQQEREHKRKEWVAIDPTSKVNIREMITKA